MILGGQTFSEQAVTAAARAEEVFSLDELEAYAARVNGLTPPAERAEWYVSGPDELGRYSLLADSGLRGHELGRTDTTGLARIQELARIHNGILA